MGRGENIELLLGRKPHPSGPSIERPTQDPPTRVSAKLSDEEERVNIILRVLESPAGFPGYHLTPKEIVEQMSSQQLEYFDPEDPVEDLERTLCTIRGAHANSLLHYYSDDYKGAIYNVGRLGEERLKQINN